MSSSQRTTRSNLNLSQPAPSGFLEKGIGVVQFGRLGSRSHEKESGNAREQTQMTRKTEFRKLDVQKINL